MILSQAPGYEGRMPVVLCFDYKHRLKELVAMPPLKNRQFSLRLTRGGHYAVGSLAG